MSTDQEVLPSKESMVFSDKICDLVKEMGNGADVIFGTNPMNTASMEVTVWAPNGKIWKSTKDHEICLVADDGDDDDEVIPLLQYVIALMERGVEPCVDPECEYCKN